MLMTWMELVMITRHPYLAHPGLHRSVMLVPYMGDTGYKWMDDTDSNMIQVGVDGLLPEQEVSIKLSRTRLNDMDDTKAMAKEVSCFGP